MALPGARLPRLTKSTSEGFSPRLSSSAVSQACSGVPGDVTPMRRPTRLSTERTVSASRVGTSRATAGAAVSPSTSRGCWEGTRGPKRSRASSDVAAASTCPWASASAAPTSDRVVFSVMASPSRLKKPSAWATRRSRYSGEVGGPLTAKLRAWSSTMRPSIPSGPRLRLRHLAIPGPPRDPIKARLLRLYTRLLREFGPQHWWPGGAPYEVAVGAILTQHTAWANAARAVAALRGRRLLRPERLAALPERTLAQVIRASGTYRLKARRLRAFTRWLLERHGGRWDSVRRAPLGALRRDLLTVVGLGPETVDAILLYAAGRHVFVADEYTRRMLVRHRLLPAGAGYEHVRTFLEAHLPSAPALFNEFHALLVAAGKLHCRATPDCDRCPLRPDLRGRPPARAR